MKGEKMKCEEMRGQEWEKERDCKEGKMMGQGMGERKGEKMKEELRGQRWEERDHEEGKMMGQGM